MIERIPLKELVSISKGKKPDELVNEEAEGFLPYLTAAQLLNKKAKQWGKGGVVATPSDVLISWDGTVGNVGWGISGIVGSTIGIIKPDLEKVDVAFLGRFLSTKKRLLNDTATGATIKHIRRSVLENLKFPSIPLSEQRRIATILEKVDAVNEASEKIRKSRELIIQATFLEMFGDPGVNPYKWERTKLKDIICVGPQNGLYKPSKDYGKGTLIVRIDSFYDGFLNNLDTLKRVNISTSEMQRYRLENGDFLINRVNSREYLGKSALVAGITEDAVFESNIMKFKISETVNKTFMIHIMQTQYFKNQILKRAKDAVNQSSINQKDVLFFEILVPPVELQDKFADIVQHIMAVDFRTPQERILGLKASIIQNMLVEMAPLY